MADGCGRTWWTMRARSGWVDGRMSTDKAVGRTGGQGGKGVDGRADGGGKGANNRANGRTVPMRRGQTDGQTSGRVDRRTSGWAWV